MVFTVSPYPVVTLAALCYAPYKGVQSKSVRRDQIFAFGVQSVGNTLGLEIGGGIIPSNNRCQVSFLLARANRSPCGCQE